MACAYCKAQRGNRHYSGCPREFIVPPVCRTKRELVEWVNTHTDLEECSCGRWTPSGTYILAHGEYDRPEYYPSRRKKGWTLSIKFFYLPNTFGRPVDGPVTHIAARVTE